MEAENMVFMSALSSAECFMREVGEPVRVLRDIELRIGSGQSWGITARTAYEIQLLLEIMGNIRPYDGGKCVLLQRGMMRQKRVIQPHLFYIGETNMLYDNMNTLEFLMFATAHMCEDRISMQEELFEFLISIGLGELSLSGIRWLSAEEKAVIALISAVYSNYRLIVWNVPGSEFDERLRLALSKITELITQRGKSLVIGAMDCELIQTACSHTAFIADGRILYQGTTDELRKEFDKVAVILCDPEIDALKSKFSRLLPDCVLLERDGALHIKAGGNTGAQQIYRKILDSGVIPQDLRINEKNVQNAYEELMRQNDLPEQLF